MFNISVLFFSYCFLAAMKKKLYKHPIEMPPPQLVDDAANFSARIEHRPTNQFDFFLFAVFLVVFEVHQKRFWALWSWPGLLVQWPINVHIACSFSDSLLGDSMIAVIVLIFFFFFFLGK